MIIPAFNEEDKIVECLQSLVDQNFTDFKAYIIDDASTDSTREKILEFQNKFPEKISLKEYGKVGPGRARNLVANESQSEFLVFMDADCIATNSWLRELIIGFKDSDVGSTGGPHLAPPQSSKFQLLVERFFQRAAELKIVGIDFYKSKNFEIIEVNHNPLCNVAYRRDLFLQVGGFHEDLFPGEDVELDFKVKEAGFKITYNPKALVYHHRPESIRQFRNVMHAYGRAQGKLVRDRGIKRKIQIVGLSVFIGFSVLFFVGNFYFGIFGSMFAIYLALAFFFIRPNGETNLGLWLNSLQWFNGFFEGFVTRRSDPPGKKK